MRTSGRVLLFPLFGLLFAAASTRLHAQSAATSGTINGTVVDPQGDVLLGATVQIINPVSQYTRTATTNGSGAFHFPNVPFNPYHLTVSAGGFAPFVQDVNINSVVATNLNIKLSLGAASSTVMVTGNEDLLESTPGFHTDVDRNMMNKLPLESQSSGLSSLITLSAPGVAADSNGLLHGLGDHASDSFSVDGQPITDQQSKVFSNQLPTNAIQSIQVIGGAPPAEYGDKTSLVIDITTRSGQGVTTPTGSITTSYGTFGSSTGSIDVSYGGPNWGNFYEMDGLDTGRFLDPPEFAVFHSKGNEENLFDRLDRQFTPADSLHWNLNYTRSWFQTPNAFDNLNVLNQFGQSVGDTDQRSQIDTFDIAPTYTRLLGANAVLNFAPYVRKDEYSYFPSDNPLADLGPVNLQQETIGQVRTLTNAGVHSDITYVKGINTVKAGTMYEQTFLRESDTLGIVNPTFNAPCLNAAGNGVDGFVNSLQCIPAGYLPNHAFLPVLLPYDLTRGGGENLFKGRTDVKELALYIEDEIKTGPWDLNLGMRGDFYNGLTVARQAEPRVGIAYTVAPTASVLRISYARTLETPFNENLVLSSLGCGNPVVGPILLCTPGVGTVMQPGFRNEFHAGLQQALGKNFVFSGDYLWKYTHNGFDFSVLGNTPITFPIDWHNSKITGVEMRADVPNFHKISAFLVLSSVAARFFPPQVAGAGATVGQPGYPFRIDHDEKLNETTHLQYQLPGRFSSWVSFNWRYDSGLVAGEVPCYANPTDPNSTCLGSTLVNGQPAVNTNVLNADEQFQAGLACDGVKATPSQPLPSPCLASQLRSKLVKIPKPGTEDNDHNPPRVQPRSLFDAALGVDNLFHGSRYKWSLQVTSVNFTNRYALYNFLSTFSGTHYVTPRTVVAEVGFHF